MKIFLLNDTATVPHIGCQAVSDAHARLLGAAGHAVVDRAFLGELRAFASADEAAGIAAVLRDDALRSRIEACDALVVNGEGTLHHGNGTEYFACLGAAQRLGKASLLVNAVFEAHAGWEQTLRALDDFCVRDLESLRHAQSHGLRARLVPDSFMGAQFGQDPTIDLDGQIVVTDWHPARDADVGEAMRRILQSVEGSFYYPMLHGATSLAWRGAAADWERAACVITARHHGVYLAARVRKPFVALPSNTRKIEGLIEAAGARIPLCTSMGAVVEAFDFLTHHLGEYERLFDWMEAQLPLTTFQALGGTADAAGPARELAALAQQVKGRGKGMSPQYWGLRNGAAAGLASPG